MEKKTNESFGEDTIFLKTNRNLYALAHLPRSGLANKLFVWGRAVRFCLEHDALLLKPCFFKPKIGPIIRRETDKRLYVGLFRPHPEREVWGIRKFFLLASLPKIQESVFADIFDSHAITGRAKIVVFRRMCGYFTPLNGQDRELSSYLQQVIQPKWLSASQSCGEIQVGMHVRLGDMGGPQRHPIDWYLSALCFVRSVLGNVSVSVFSDGRDEELLPILREPNVRIVRTGSAISDLLALSCSKFLIGTGSSTFSAWAAYLGQMPAMTRLGNPFSWFNLKNREGRFIGEWDANKPNADHRLTLELQRVFR